LSDKNIREGSEKEYRGYIHVDFEKILYSQSDVFTPGKSLLVKKYHSDQ
jgi:hypothetical protein